MHSTTRCQLITRCRICMLIIMIGLILSGITAFPIETELGWLINHMAAYPEFMGTWLDSVYRAVQNTNKTYPYLSYGTDWLAFAHLVLAVLFIGAYKNPVKNVWVIEFGIISAITVFPLAFVAGGIRGIPVFWRLIDCSFGVIALIPLAITYRAIKTIITLEDDRL